MIAWWWLLVAFVAGVALGMWLLQPLPDEGSGGTVTDTQDEWDEASALVLDVFTQACLVSPTGMPRAFDHYHISAYKDAQDKLIEWGAIKREECVRD